MRNAMARMTAAAGTFIAAFCIGAASAQSAPPTSAASSAPPATPLQHKLFRGSKIIGSDVRNAQGAKIGQVKDLILDGRRGEIAYAAVAFGSVTSMGRKFHPVPWQLLEPSDDGNYYILHADRETIGQAPGFDAGKWPDMNDQAWNAEIDRYWSRMAGRGSAGANRLSSGASGASSGGNPKAGASGTR
ncbi:PRC-barrel domain containing protein [Herbaspirillum sp. HC18]|nr:PRC-barrel domain containing protein [Herbaspirillum sp. HC18]